MSSDSSTQTEWGQGARGEPGDSFEAKKLMKERQDGKWREDPAKIRGAIKQWGKSDSFILLSDDESTLKQLYIAWDYWMRDRLGHSWTILKGAYGNKTRFYEIFVEYIESNENLYDICVNRADRIGSHRMAEIKMHEKFKTSSDVDVVSTKDEDDDGDAVFHVDRNSRDSKLKHHINLEPTEVDRAGVDVELDDLEGYTVLNNYPVNGIPSLLLTDGEKTVEVPMHYLAEME